MTGVLAPNPLLRALALFWLALKRPFLLPRVRRTTLEHIRGVPFLVWSDVHNPVVFRSGQFLADALVTLPALPAESQPDVRALDMGCGSGVGSIFAARRGYRVTAVDVNPEAVRCTRINVLLNRLEHTVDVRQGDLFAPVEGERFQLILFNPPFFRGVAKNLFELSWRSPDVLERFACGLRAALAPDGEALILLSTDGDAPAMLAALDGQGFRAEPELHRNLGNEIMTLYSVRPA
jgi:methylase of polypeptide subunit release factors